MRQTSERFAFTLGSYLLLVVAAAGSIGLNTDLWDPPRFDGAGYAVLGEALVSGSGYREINQPEAPWHDHFPPGYPATLALIWRFTGRSVLAAHVFSVCCSVAAVLLAWRWFRTFYSPRSAFMLGLALALNWTWGRIGGSIQSEPLFMLCELLAVHATIQAGRRGKPSDGIALALVLAACVLIRHVGVCLAVTAFVDLGLRGRWKVLLLAGLTAVVLILPWVAWLAIVHHHTQIGLFAQQGLAVRVARQAVFYLQRLPDQITGPFVEVGTAPNRSRSIAFTANIWAAIVTTILVWGWVRTLRAPRRRLAGMIAFATLGLLLIWPFTEAGRFLIPLVPFMLVGMTECVGKVMGRARLRHPRDIAAVVVLAVSVPYAVYSVVNGRALAQRLTHADVDNACEWISLHPRPSGPVLTRHPGEVFWQTGRPAVEPDSADPDAIEGLIDRLGVIYLMIDENRYVNAVSNPLQQYVDQYPERVALVWSGRHGNASVRVFAIRQAKGQIP